MTADAEGCPPRQTHLWLTIRLSIAAMLPLLLAACYHTQPDRLAAVTLVPAWCWLLPAAWLAKPAFRRDRPRWLAGLLLLWVAFTALFAPEVRSLLRIGRSQTAVWQAAREQGRAIRVVSLNCSVGSPAAAAEVAQYEPDIVLFQESPSAEQLASLADQWWGEDGTCLWDHDTSILARGQIEARNRYEASHFNHGVVTLGDGLTLHVFSVRLNPPVFRLDFWTPGFWRDHCDNRILHRRQLADVMEIVDGLPTSAHVIVGGDLNAPAGDGAFDVLGPRLRDTFADAGCGWGNTGTNGLPLFRVDQVWASDGLAATLVTAKRTVHSDHRLVVCDLIVER